LGSLATIGNEETVALLGPLVSVRVATRGVHVATRGARVAAEVDRVIGG